MRGLTLTQPWASLIAIGAKRIETRSWKTGYRGPLAIHASKTFLAEELHWCWEPPFRRALEPARLVDYGAYRDLLPHSAERYELMPLGSIVCVADLVTCQPTDSATVRERLTATRDEEAFGDYFPGRWAWLLENVRPLAKPVACRGFQFLWTPDPATLAQVEEQLR